MRASGELGQIVEAVTQASEVMGEATRGGREQGEAVARISAAMDRLEAAAGRSASGTGGLGGRGGGAVRTGGGAGGAGRDVPAPGGGRGAGRSAREGGAQLERVLEIIRGARRIGVRWHSMDAHSLIAVFLSVAVASSAYADGASSPQDLAARVQAIIQSQKIDGIAELVQPEAPLASMANFKSDLVAYIGAEDLTVYVVPKDDKEAVRKFASESPMPSALKPLDDRVEKYRSAGRSFSVLPLGDLVISGKRAGASSKRSMSSVVYGKQNGRYLIVFAKLTMKAD